MGSFSSCRCGRVSWTVEGGVNVGHGYRARCRRNVARSELSTVNCQLPTRGSASSQADTTWWLSTCLVGLIQRRSLASTTTSGTRRSAPRARPSLLANGASASVVCRHVICSVSEPRRTENEPEAKHDDQRRRGQNC